MLQRLDDVQFWQSVTGSLESDELPYQTALREVFEETGVDIMQSNLTLVDCHYSVEYEIFPQFLHRYAPGTRINKEHWFYLPLPNEMAIALSEHSAFCWLPAKEAAALTKSPNNATAILRCAQKWGTVDA